ncbi:MAG: Chromosome-partitioning protein ParB [Alphaproteobacteria bacterium MarineAlpha6_Bin1]|nr:MAG: Chromosome-partitioning protein ParB [Alphaproteobacteria bacterium MarineAlpha6_Bin1]
MKKRLGKGLSALIDDVDNSINFDVEEQANLISLKKIHLANLQVRKKFNQESLEQLSKSIKNNGLVQPIILRKSKNNDDFELIAGERRLRATRILKLDKILSIVINVDDKKAFEIGLIENLQRDDLSPVEEAEGYKRLINEFSYTQEQLSEVVSKSRSHIANLLRILQLPEKVKKYILDGNLSLGHARCLVGYVGAVELAERIVKEGLSVRYVERLFHQKDLNINKENFDKKKTIKEKDADTSLLEKELSLKLGVKLTINDKNNKGNIKIEYRNIDQREKILNKLRRG